MKLFRPLAFLLFVLVFSWPVFQFFQLNPGYFPVPDFSPKMWELLKSCCGVSSYEDKQDFEFLMTVLISLLISFLCVLLVFKLARWQTSSSS
ncbi:MAG: hypothetical protein RLO04_04775 [Limnobacter sp.]|uniref:hypothetical protein n=1 Tax=Limnobacter sp. TaxID=2003368 RepID=UPI0027330868|nr:hypothetical protein [Limnobacter sp.]MDP3189215.1 hypothetical protein [Limnobacter sp.]